MTRPVPAWVRWRVAAVGALAAACLGAPAAAPAQSAAALADAPPFDLADPARISVGKRRFGSTCAAYCHGAEGEGGKTPRFKGRADFAPAAAFRTISEGRRGTDVMPPWGKAFSPEQIWELVAYLKFLAEQPAPPQ